MLILILLNKIGVVFFFFLKKSILLPTGLPQTWALHCWPYLEKHHFWCTQQHRAKARTVMRNILSSNYLQGAAMEDCALLPAAALGPSSSLPVVPGRSLLSGAFHRPEARAVVGRKFVLYAV